jgi:sugar phosphate isomerase/epimerase
MKIAAMDTMWADLSFGDRIRHVADLGFTGIQLWLGAAELGFRVVRQWSLDKEPKPLWMTPKELAKVAQDAEINIVALGQYCVLGDMAGLGPTAVDIGRRREARIEDIKAMMNYVAEVGGGIVVCESGGDPNKPEQWKSLLEIVNELVAHAENVGAILAMEHASIFLIDTEDALLRLVKEINSKALRINFDPANLALTPPGNRDIPSAIRKLQDCIVMMHAKDAIYHKGPYGTTLGEKPTYDCPPMGEGKVPWKECARVLKEIDYKGYLVVEYAEAVHAQKPENVEDGVIQGKRYLEGIFANL